MQGLAQSINHWINWKSSSTFTNASQLHEAPPQPSTRCTAGAVQYAGDLLHSSIPVPLWRHSVAAKHLQAALSSRFPPKLPTAVPQRNNETKQKIPPLLLKAQFEVIRPKLQICGHYVGDCRVRLRLLWMSYPCNHLFCMLCLDFSEQTWDCNSNCVFHTFIMHGLGNNKSLILFFIIFFLFFSLPCGYWASFHGKPKG